MKLLRKRWRRLAAGTAVAVVAGVAWWGATAGDGTPVRASGQRITVVDGPHDDQRVPLDATFFRPARPGRVPAVLLAHGFGGSKDDVKDEAVDLARHGYAVLTWSARGFGRSGGQIALDSPEYEVKDVRQLIDWLARRPDVRLDGPGDPRVGIAGQSYGGAIALLAAAYDRRVDAIAPQITWYDLADALFPDASGGGARRGVFKKLWAGIFFTNGSPAGPASTACGRFLPSLCSMYQKIAERGRPTADAITTLRRSSPSSVTGRIHVPTLLIQGQADSLFPLDQADDNAHAITGAPVKVVWYQGGHDGGEPETARLRALERGWFDRYLKSGAGDPADFTVTRAAVIAGRWVEESMPAAHRRPSPRFPVSAR
jgi:ABC-2 type transport system ATP-binding protein